MKTVTTHLPPVILMEQFSLSGTLVQCLALLTRAEASMSPNPYS